MLLIASTQWTLESFRQIEEQERPYVLVDRRFRGLAAKFVGTDDLALGREHPNRSVVASTLRS